MTEVEELDRIRDENVALQAQVKRQQEALQILRSCNRLKHDLDAYLLAITDWGLGQLKDFDDNPTDEKPDPKDFGVE